MGKKKHRRTIVMEIRLPVAVRLTVEATTDDETAIEDADWTIVAVRDSDNYAKASSVRTVTEAMADDDHEELARLAREAEDA